MFGGVENSENGEVGGSIEGGPVTNSSRAGPELRRSVKVVWRRWGVWLVSVGEGAAVANVREERWGGRGCATGWA